MNKHVFGELQNTEKVENIFVRFLRLNNIY